MDPGESRPLIHLDAVTKRFASTTAVDHVTLSILEGELFGLLGGSGSGKTTLLRLLAGFERPTSGRVLIGGEDMTDVPPHRRPVNMMFQSYALFPHMNVAKNVGFGLRQERMPRAEVDARVEEMLNMVELAGFGQRRPDELSGGQRQRVALARSLVKRPKVLLLDEPLAALDKRLREQTQFELMRIQEEVGITFIVVTHDQEEAMTLSTRIGVMRAGRIEQTGSPLEIYEAPASRFVADFIGNVNLFDAVVEGVDNDGVSLCAQGVGRIRLTTDLALSPSTACALAIRPEKLRLGVVEPEAINRVQGTVKEIAYLGALSVVRVALASGAVLEVRQANAERMLEHRLDWDQPVWVSWDTDAALVLEN